MTRNFFLVFFFFGFFWGEVDETRASFSSDLDGCGPGQLGSSRTTP